MINFCNMEHIKKGIDDKLTTVTKLQLNYRQKKLDYATFALGNEVQLPPITNVLVRFPSVNKEKVDIKNSRKRKNIIELDRILENSSHNQMINSDDINRIIFASPMKNRITFQRTFFRSSLYFTIDDKKSKLSNHSIKVAKNEEKMKEEAYSLPSTQIKNQQQNQKIEEIKINWLSQPNGLDDKKKTRYSNVLDSNPESILEKRKKERTWRRAYESKLPHNVNRSTQIYSPWKNDDLEEQLIL